MPRLLPIKWIRQIAINYLLELYEKEDKFMREWEEMRLPFATMIEKIASVSCLIHVEHILRKCPPHDLISWVSDMQKLKRYIQGPSGGAKYIQDLSELQEIYADLEEQLKPYVKRLNNLAYNWKLRALWASDELMFRDVQRVQEAIMNAADVTVLNKLSNEQIHKLIDKEEGLLPSDIWPAYMNIVSFYLAGGRGGYISEVNDRLGDFEGKLKASGAKEPPSALRKHAEWWFDHYVHDIEFPEIAERIAKIDDRGGPQAENIRKAVIRFSELLGIDPIERT